MNRCPIRIFLYGVILFSIGLFQIAVTPAFEGFDELAHYSAIRQIALEKRIPLRNDSYVEQILVDYHGPRPYSSGVPPFDNGLIYKKFFQNSSLIQNYVSHYSLAQMPVSFIPSNVKNHEYQQHPALYYLLLAPVLEAFVYSSLMTQVFVLRFCSFMLALTGIILGLLALSVDKKSAVQESYNQDRLGFFIYPFVFPMTLLEFARIGNDSLCLLLVGVVAYFWRQWLRDTSKTRFLIVIGIALGLGLWTKAFFVLISAALLVYFVASALQKIYRSEVTPYSQLKMVLFTFVPAALVGAGWYVFNYVTLGSFSGASVVLELTEHGGFWRSLQENFDVFVFLRGLAVIPITFVWGGTQSLAHLPSFFYLPLLGFLFVLFVPFTKQLLQLKLADSYWLSFWLFSCFLLALGSHALINMATGGNGNTPGWYLHILLPLSAPMLGSLLYQKIFNVKIQPVARFAAAYGFIFLAVATWYQLTLFYGCAEKGQDKSYEFNSKYLCIDQSDVIIDRISVLGHPYVALLSLILLLAASISLIMVYRLAALSDSKDRAAHQQVFKQ